MIDNTNQSKNPSNVEYTDIKKYIGVASVKVLSVNPDNAKLRKYGWNVPEDAEEPVYISHKQDESGKETTTARLRFLVQIQDLEDKPVISLDFFCRPEPMTNKGNSEKGILPNTKAKVIDQYGRTAWASKEDISSHSIPVYTNGPAAISTPYKLCHPGEEEVVMFLYKLLNITPLQIFDRAKNTWVASTNPGRLTIDNWNDLCCGSIKEIATYLSQQPDNCVKVVLGVRTTDNNRTYQTFLNTGYIGNGATPDRNTGEYTTARKLIDKETNPNNIFSAAPVREWKETASEVQDNSEVFNPGDYASVADEHGDLPF